jgi:hypothetical protein
MVALAFAGSFACRKPEPPPAAAAPKPAAPVIPVIGTASFRAPLPGSAARSPLVVEGSAPGGWYFEASFPVRLEDAAGRVLAEAPAQAEGEWMTPGEVPFHAVLEFAQPAPGLGRLVARRVSMEDGRELERVEQPVRFTARDQALADPTGRP